MRHLFVAAGEYAPAFSNKSHPCNVSGYLLYNKKAVIAYTTTALFFY
jgi:hypothetical protein